MLRIIKSSNRRIVNRLIERRISNDDTVKRYVSQIVRNVRRGGDKVLLKYARRFDRLSAPIEITQEEIREGAHQTPSNVRTAIRTSARHIRMVARKQLPRNWRTTVMRGVSVETNIRPLDRVGCYVPGGRYPLPSSLLMTAVPAQVAGVPDIIAVCPRPEPAVLSAALEAGVTRLFRIGGAHTIAALAYGTETIPNVDKIVGPGNVYVSTAKAQVSTHCAIDFYAGPTEIVIISRKGNPEWLAADLIAQAEHDPSARAILLTPNRQLAIQVARKTLDRLPRSGPARLALRRNGAIITTRDLREATDLANQIAPEHLVCDEEKVAKAITRAGTIFVGHYAAQAAGDYATGSNHVLPTNGSARFRGGLSAADFVRVNSLQRLTNAGLTGLAETAMVLARTEGLNAHAESIRVRLK